MQTDLDKRLLEIMAKAISGAPFPTTKSMAKARAVVNALDNYGHEIKPKGIGAKLFRESVADDERLNLPDSNRFRYLSNGD